MKLISNVTIKGFRSIRDSGNSLKNMENFNVFAGLNNSGKSNFLKAMNAFFTSRTEPENNIYFPNDYYRYDLHRKLKNKCIEIIVDFNLPSNFQFRQKLGAAEKLLGRKFAITKKWHRETYVPEYFLNKIGDPLNLGDRQKIDQFLQLINFRYIPNRVLPIEIIKNEHQALRDVLVRRLGKEAKSAGETFDRIQEISSKLIRNLSSRLSKINIGAKNVRLATPKNWADMIFAFGYRLGDGQIELDDAVQGSGIQSLLMLETLFLIDKDYFQQFGWRQASIWAVEEPESSLHTTMEAQAASFLRTISNEDKSRLQIFATTHSDLIVQYSDKCFFVEQKDNISAFEGGQTAKEILDKASQVGISRYVHPLLFYPLETVILVDGKYDAPFVKKGLEILNKKVNVVVSSLESMHTNKAGGEADILKYLKDNKEIVANRNVQHPIIVLLDWESNKLKEYKKLSKQLDKRLFVLQWPENDANPKLDKNFCGMERFYPVRLITKADKKCPNKIATRQNGVKTVPKRDYDEIKKVLYEEIVTNGLKDKDIDFAKGFLQKVLKIINDISEVS